jgi:hypothetical protein
MKKLVLAAVLSAFSFSAAAHACDGMKGQAKSDQTQSKKQEKKQDDAKTDQKT